MSELQRWGQGGGKGPRLSHWLTDGGKKSRWGAELRLEFDWKEWWAGGIQSNWVKNGTIGGRVGVIRGSPGTYRWDDQGQLIVSVMFSCTMNHLPQIATGGWRQRVWGVLFPHKLLAHKNVCCAHVYHCKAHLCDAHPQNLHITGYFCSCKKAERKPDVSEREKYLELLLYSSWGSVGSFYYGILSENIKVCKINCL